MSATECLEAAGVRPTAERVEALALLLRARGKVHTIRELMAPDDVDGEHAVTQGAGATRLYRALHALEQKGLVEREVLEVRGRAVFGFRAGEPAAQPQPQPQPEGVRLQCRQCGRTAHEPSPELQARLAELGTCRDVVVLYTCTHCAAAAVAAD